MKGHSITPFLKIPSLSKMDKRILVERCQHGDREALGLLYSRYSAKMMRIIRHYIADPADAGDILHDGFVVAFTQISSLRNPDKLEYWLGTIMKNLSIQHLNQVELNTLLDDECDITDMPEIQNIISMEELEAIINKLPKGYRKVFKLAVLDNKSHREIGKLLGIAPHSSSSQLFRAKEMLRKIIREQGIELAGATSIILLLLTLMPRLLQDELPTLPPVAHQSEELFLAISTPAEDLTAQLPAAYTNQSITPNHYYNTVASSTSLTDNSQQQRSESSSASTIETTENVGPTANQPELESAPNKEEESISTRQEPATGRDSQREPDITSRNRYTSGSSWSSSTTNTRQQFPRITIGATFSTSGMNGINSPELSNYDYVASDGLFNDMHPLPLSSTPPTVSTVIEPEKVTDVQHSPTITVGITANMRLTRTLSVESGIRYSYLRSKVTTTHSESEHKSHYIGIPVKLNLSLYTNSRLNIYASAGGAVDLPVSSSKVIEGYSTHSSAPVQWSLSGGAGAQYTITPHVSVYAEPSLRYNFHNSGSTTMTKWQDDRFEFTLPVGLRFNF